MTVRPDARSLGAFELTSSLSELSALDRLFSSAVFQEMARKGRSPLFSRLIYQAGVVERCGKEATVGSAFDTAFARLRTAGSRNEYVYRAAVTKNVLLGKHSLRTASMLNEVRAGDCKADLVILNGTASVYEIKSERDSLARLVNQVANYKRVFATVNVIVGEDHIGGVQRVLDGDVGILMLSRRYRISQVREAVDAPERTCPATIFETLRSAEAVAILKTLDITVPDVPNTRRHAVLRALFAELDPADVHCEMVKTLKRTRSLVPLAELVARLPVSLQAAALSIPVRHGDHDRVVSAVETPLEMAMEWA
ncbi:sce7726 family protein [Sphingobium yanoikuyae]|uniref:sce7726 family protein n=1 Tax=Sphingobium yanoikuyae TaxID=13690 RepID=UPI00345F0A14